MTLVARLDGALVGSAVVSPPGLLDGCDWYRRPGVAVVSMLGVDPTLRGTGLGARLLAAAEEAARSLGAAELALDTAVPAVELREWYSRRGYREVDEADWSFTSFLSVVLSKSLLEVR